MDQVFSFLFSFSTRESKLSTIDSWDFTPAVGFIVVVVIIGFAIVAAGWAIKRDV